jgi:opacity protein-like surface antigen
MKKNRLLVIIIFSLIATNGFSQGKTEYSGFFDSYYYKGIRNLNITGNFGLALPLSDLPTSPGMAAGLGVNYKLWPRMMFGAEFHYLSMAGKDNQSNRNLKFTSSNLEFLGYARYYFVDDIIRVAADRARGTKFLKSYLILGVGLLKYNATATFTKPFPPTDSIYNYSEKGSGLGLVIPAGLGFSWKVSNRVSLITELSYRYTFSDHLDAISTRANPKSKDSYMVMDFKLQFSPWIPAKKKSKTLSPPEKYEGPKGTETWKNRPKEQPAKKRNYYEEPPVEETPKEETPAEETPTEETPKEETPTEEVK